MSTTLAGPARGAGLLLWSRPAAASTIALKTPTREALARFDRKRKKKGANKDWTSPSDADAKITIQIDPFS